VSGGEVRGYSPGHQWSLWANTVCGKRLKQFAHIVYNFWLQKRSTFEYFAQFASWSLTTMGGVKGYFWGVGP